MTKENISSGFRAIGIYPLNPAAVNSYLAPSDIFAAPDDAAAAVDMQVDEDLPEPASTDHISVRTENGQNQEEEHHDAHEDGSDEGFETNVLGEEARLEMECEFEEVPDSSASHYFVAPNPADTGEGALEIATIDNAKGEPDSITRFLTLPTIAARASSKRKDPLLDFTKSKILTSDEYLAAVQRLNDVKELAAREKERLRTEKESTRQRKAAEKEARAAAIAQARARRTEEREEAARLKALYAAEAAAARAAKAAEKARSTSTRRGGRATEISQGREFSGQGEETTEIPIAAQEAGPADFSFNAGGIQNPYFSYASPSPGMQHPYFLPFNQFGNRVISMSPNPQPQTILQPPSLQHAPHIFLAQGWAPTEGRRGEGRRGDGGREERAGRSR